MVSKGLVGAAAGGAAILAALAFMAMSGFFPGPGAQLQPPAQQVGTTTTPQGMQDVILSLTSVQVQKIDEENVKIEVVFDVFNPNRNTLVLETIEYKLIANGIRIAQSDIGERLQGAVTGTGQTYYVVPDLPLTLKDTIQLRKTEIFTPIWSDLQKDKVEWRVSGLFVITDPIRLGGQEKPFDFNL